MIPSIILEEAKHFMTFMSSMVEELLGNEELMISILRNQNRTAEINEFLEKNLTNAEIPASVPEDPADEVFKTTEIKKRHSVKKPRNDDDEEDYQRYQEYMRSKAAAYDNAVKSAKDAEQQQGQKPGKGRPKPHGGYNPKKTMKGQKSPNYRQDNIEAQ
ncbi:hypothetical protein FGO68_gene13777 [Halteria grandinella]|uniref:Uncharacterized protein n=1 Tax=Halteria grandinella TaxID=5974 RepID=A0A8J8NVS4_HALGN|nr:hypothetical protein FGO68_gene13777 [Halteria grandinella]